MQRVGQFYLYLVNYWVNKGGLDMLMQLLQNTNPKPPMRLMKLAVTILHKVSEDLQHRMSFFLLSIGSPRAFACLERAILSSPRQCL